MIKINRKTDYAVRVLLALAKQPKGEIVPTRKIREEMLIPKAFTQRIVADLARDGLIRTYPGPKGGLQLGKSPNEITLLDVVEAIDKQIYISDCLRAPGECPLDVGCPVRGRWAKLQAMILHELAGVNLEELAEEAFQIEENNKRNLRLNLDAE